MLLFPRASAASPQAAASAPSAAPARSAPILIDQTGRKFTLTSLIGRPLIITFVSAHCTDACPLVNAQFAQAARDLAAGSVRARLLTITLDPEHDSPATMRALAVRFEANSRYWLVAGGRIADVSAVVRAFGVVAEPGERGYREAHTTLVYVFDARGRLQKTMLASSGLAGDIETAIAGVQRLATR